MSAQVEAIKIGLKAHFGELKDPRSTINRKHLLVDVVVIAICGTVAGADGPDAIAVWAKSRRDWLAQYLELPHGLPSKDCLRRVLRGLNPACFQAWLQALAGPDGARFVSVDGKTLRRSHDQGQGLPPLHLVSAWAHEEQLTLAQVATDAKSNEITAIPLLLDLIELQGTVVTIDAMGTQREIATKIINGKGEYVLPVKGNQPTLSADVQAVFDQLLESESPSPRLSVLETAETQHGRLEQRTYMQTNVPRTFPRWVNGVA